jgi:hypothetical protein
LATGQNRPGPGFCRNFHMIQDGYTLLPQRGMVVAVSLFEKRYKNE